MVKKQYRKLKHDQKSVNGVLLQASEIVQVSPHVWTLSFLQKD